MAFDCQERKPLLYSDLFKPRKTTTAKEKEHYSNTIMSGTENLSSSSSWNQSLFSCDSSSSGFSTPLYSDLGSSGSDDGDFIAELTRQMAERMLQEEDEGIAIQDCEIEDCLASGIVKDTDGGSEKNCENTRMPPIPNQGRVSKRRGRRAKKGESAQSQKKQLQKTEQQNIGGGEWGIGHARNGYPGSAMQAVFLGGSGSGSRSLPTGTGVFLPRATTVTSGPGPTEPKKKSGKKGCPIVLIPTRVMQVLELHFNRIQDSTTSPSDISPNCLCPTEEGSRSDGDSKLENMDEHEMLLPQEWTY